MLSLCFMLSYTKSKAQSPIRLYEASASAAATGSKVSDTLTATETTYYSTKTKDLQGSLASSYVLYFQADTTVYSSAPTLNVYLQGSMDGVTWFNLNGCGCGVDGKNADTLNSATFTGLVQRMSATSKATKYVYGSLVGNNTTNVNYVRAVFSHSGSGTSTRVYNIYLKTSY